MNWTDNIGAQTKKVTVMVTGYESTIHEPLLLEALANHPDVGEVYFVPFDHDTEDGSANRALMLEETGEHPIEIKNYGIESVPELEGKPYRFMAYDMTRLLQREVAVLPSEPEALRKKINDFIARQPSAELSTKKVDMVVSGNNLPAIDMHIARRHPNIHYETDPVMGNVAKNKLDLPFLNHNFKDATGRSFCAPLKHVTRINQVENFMDEHGYDEIVLKNPSSIAGRSVFKVYRDGPGGGLWIEHNEVDKTEKPPSRTTVTKALENKDFDHDGMLAMQFLRPDKGDMRVVISHGKVIGAYKRIPKDEEWLIQNLDGEAIVPIDWEKDIAPEMRRHITLMAQALYKFTGVGIANVDWLEGDDGALYLSEINVNLTEDLDVLHEHGQVDAADKIAKDCMDAYQRHVSEHRESVHR